MANADRALGIRAVGRGRGLLGPAAGDVGERNADGISGTKSAELFVDVFFSDDRSGTAAGLWPEDVPEDIEDAADDGRRPTYGE